MKDIQQETGTAYLFIAHDLSMVKYISDRIGVLHLGHLLETVRPKRSSGNPSTLPSQPAVGHPSPPNWWWKNAEWLRPTTTSSASTTIRHRFIMLSGSHYVKCTDEEFAK